MKNFNRISLIFGYGDKFLIAGDNRHSTSTCINIEKSKTSTALILALKHNLAFVMIWSTKKCFRDRVHIKWATMEIKKMVLFAQLGMKHWLPKFSFGYLHFTTYTNSFCKKSDLSTCISMIFNTKQHHIIVTMWNWKLKMDILHVLSVYQIKFKLH